MEQDLWRASDDIAHALVQTVDRGYAMAGGTSSCGAGASDFWLVKTDVSGNILWNRTFGGASDDVAEALIQTGEGGYAIAGATQSYGAGYYDFWLVKTDVSGNVLWNQTYGGTNLDWGEALVQTNDGGYVIAGGTWSIGAGKGDVWLVKTDALGKMQWNKTYGGTMDDMAHALIQTGDGGYAVAGYVESYGAGSSDFWLVKTDAWGNAAWNKTYGGASQDWPQAIVETSDDGYAVAGYTEFYGNGMSDFWLIRTDASGNVLWNQTYGGTSPDWAEALVMSGDGGFAIAGRTGSFGAGEYDFWLVKTNASGVIRELPSFLILQIFMIAATLVGIVCRRRHLLKWKMDSGKKGSCAGCTSSPPGLRRGH